MKKVCSKTATWIFVLMLMIPGSVLSAEDPPSPQDPAVREAQPVTTTPVPPALHQALASSLGEAASFGAKVIPARPTGTWGIVSAGDGGGGVFLDSDSEAEAWLGTNGYGVEGFGATAGGYFEDSDGPAYSYVGYGSYGIQAFGPFAGGYFGDTDGTGEAWLGGGDIGVQGEGTYAGGYFAESNLTSLTYVAKGGRGIEALGTEMGGYFKDWGQSGYSYVGYGNRGIEAYGSGAGGYFEDTDGIGVAYVGFDDRGIEAYGSEMGGYFRDFGQSGYSYVGYGNRGIEAYGSGAGGYFEDTDGTSYATVGFGVYGISAYGDQAGGAFGAIGGTGSATVGTQDRGILASGADYGGKFVDTDSSGFAYVGHSTYKIFGVGSVSFVQNHPNDPSSVIVYAAPEGDEVATYTRGTARLVEGEATVPLGETFKWVTNPDIGLTAHLTPRGEPIPLAVVELSTGEMIVRAPSDAPEGLEFDYMVYGLRIGFEESSIVQEKDQESYIPSMADHRKLYERRPDLRNYNSLERFKGMRRIANPKAELDLDLSRSQALRDAIIEFDPAVHELPGPARPEEMTREDATEGNEGQREGVQSGERVRPARTDQGRRLAPGHSSLNAAIPVDDEGNVYATSFRPSSQDLASLVDVSEEVKPGDVLVIDRDNPGMMRKAFEAHDTGVVGVVALDAGVVVGTQPPATEVIEEGAAPSHRAAIGVAGVVTCNVDAAYGAVWPGDLLVTSPTLGHAMRADSPLPGTTLGKALEPLEEGTGTIKVMVMLR